MTISVSEGGVFKEAKGIWTSKDGDWIVLKEPVPDFGMDVAFLGTWDNGYFEVTIYGENILDYTLNLYAREYADQRASYVRVQQKEVPNTVQGPASVLFTGGGCATNYKSRVHADGWVAAIYHIELVALDGTVTRSADFPVQGEIQMSTFQFESTATCFATEPNTSRTITEIWTNTGTRGTTPNSTASWWWLMDYDRMSAILANYDFTLPVVLGPGWGQPPGPYTHVICHTEGGIPQNLFEVQSAPVVGSAFPPETQGRVINDNELFEFVLEEWSPTPPKAVSAHTGGPGSYPLTDNLISTESEGLTAVMFYGQAGPYLPYDGTITLIDNQTIQVTGPPGAEVALTYEFPLAKYDIITRQPTDTIYTKRSVAVACDASGVATFTPLNFPAMVEFGWTEFFAGVYHHTGAQGSPRVMVDGSCPALTWWESHYGSVYSDVSWNVKYISSSPWSDTFTITSSFYTYDGTSYATLYMKRIHEPLPREYWVRTGPDTMLVYTLYPAFNIFTPAGDPVIGQPFPTETLVFSSSEIAGYVPGQMYPIRSLGYIDTAPYGFTGGNRAANPGGGDYDVEPGNYSDYIYLYPVVHLQYTAPV